MGVRGEAPVRLGEWVSRWLRKPAKKAEGKGQAPGGAAAARFPWRHQLRPGPGLLAASPRLPSSRRRTHLTGRLGPMRHQPVPPCSRHQCCRSLGRWGPGSCPASLWIRRRLYPGRDGDRGRPWSQIGGVGDGAMDKYKPAPPTPAPKAGGPS